MQLLARPAKQGYTLKSLATQLLRDPYPAKIDETDAPTVVVIRTQAVHWQAVRRELMPWPRGLRSCDLA